MASVLLMAKEKKRAHCGNDRPDDDDNTTTKNNILIIGINNGRGVLYNLLLYSYITQLDLSSTPHAYLLFPVDCIAAPL